MLTVTTQQAHSNVLLTLATMMVTVLKACVKPMDSAKSKESVENLNRMITLIATLKLAHQTLTALLLVNSVMKENVLAVLLTLTVPLMVRSVLPHREFVPDHATFMMTASSMKTATIKLLLLTAQPAHALMMETVKVDQLVMLTDSVLFWDFQNLNKPAIKKATFPHAQSMLTVLVLENSATTENVLPAPKTLIAMPEKFA